MRESLAGKVAMLACNRIGAVHSVVFGGFSAEAEPTQSGGGEGSSRPRFSLGRLSSDAVGATLRRLACDARLEERSPISQQSRLSSNCPAQCRRGPGTRTARAEADLQLSGTDRTSRLARTAEANKG